MKEKICKFCGNWSPYGHNEDGLGSCSILGETIEIDLSWMRCLSGNELVDLQSEVMGIDTYGNFGCIKWENDGENEDD